MLAPVLDAVVPVRTGRRRYALYPTHPLNVKPA